jgi:hypothetical protein
LKLLLITTVLAGSLAVPAFADDAPPSPHLKLALEYLQHELDARLDPPAKQPLRLDQASSRAMSEAEKTALREVFGTEQVLDIRRLPGKGRQAEYSLRIPGHQLERDGQHTEWQDVQARFSVDASGKRYSSSGAWPGIQLQDKDDTISVANVRFSAQQTRDVSGIWLGKSHADAERISLQSKKAPINVQFEHATVDSNSKRQGKKIDAFAETGASRMLVAGTAIEQLHFAFNLRGMDADTLKTYREASRQRHAGDMPDKEAAAADIKQSLAMFRQLALKGGSVEVSDISGIFEGAKFQIKGRVAMPGLTEADLDSSAKTLAKLDAQLDISLPLPILHAIARGIVHVTNEKAGKEQLREQDAYDVMLGKLLGSGYARMEKEKLVAHLEIKHGMLRITDSKEPIALEFLLKALDQHDKGRDNGNDNDSPEAPPPDDHSSPVGVTWRDRSLENVRLFAGNGDEAAIDELCYRYTKGDHAPQSDEEAGQWCPRSKSAPDLSDANHHSDDPAIFNLSEKPGYYSVRVARFDESKARELELRLSNPGKDAQWLPMMSICLTAEAPSEQACIKFSRYQLDDPTLSAQLSLVSTDAKSDKKGQTLANVQPQDGVVRLRAFVRGQKAHFIVNDRDELVQDVVFPVETIRMLCSTADCSFKFL